MNKTKVNTSFAIFSKNIMSCTKISNMAKLYYLALKCYEHKNLGVTWVSNRRICEDLNISERSGRRYKKELLENGFIRKKRDRKKNVIYIHFFEKNGDFFENQIVAKKVVATGGQKNGHGWPHNNKRNNQITTVLQEPYQRANTKPTKSQEKMKKKNFLELDKTKPAVVAFSKKEVVKKQKQSNDTKKIVMFLKHNGMDVIDTNSCFIVRGSNSFGDLKVIAVKKEDGSVVTNKGTISSSTFMRAM